MPFDHNEPRPEPKALALAVTGGDATLTMSSLEIAELTGKEHRNVMRDIRKMLDEMDEGGVLKFEHTHQNPQNGQTYPIFRLPKRECLILVSGYDVPLRAKIIDRWMELEGMVAAPPPRPLTTTETLIEMLKIQAEVERKQAEHDVAIAGLRRDVAKVAEAVDVHVVLDRQPPNTESIMHIRKRIGKRFGLSVRTIDTVMRQSPYAPKLAAVVRNTRVEDVDTTYMVYHSKDVTMVFERFVAECEQVTPERWTHPYIETPFKLSHAGRTQ